MHQRERTGGEIAWEELCWEGSGTENAELLARGLHKAAFTQRSFTRRRIFLHSEACTQGRLYTQSLYTEKGFTQERFYTKKLLHREVFIQSSLGTEKLAHTQRLLHREAFNTEKSLHRVAFTRKSLYTQRL